MTHYNDTVHRLLASAAKCCTYTTMLLTLCNSTIPATAAHQRDEKISELQDFVLRSSSLPILSSIPRPFTGSNAPRMRTIIASILYYDQVPNRNRQCHMTREMKLDKAPRVHRRHSLKCSRTSTVQYVVMWASALTGWSRDDH